jgi:hypothetical protein
MYDGRINVESEFSKGSTFTVELMKNSQQNPKNESEIQSNNILVKTDPSN